MNQIQIMLSSLVNLFDQDIWKEYFGKLEQLIGSKLSHLDTNDPIRKKVSNLEDAASFVCDISERENSRTLFAKFGRSKVEMTITLYRDTEHFANNISIYFPEKFLSDGENQVCVINDIFTMSAGNIKPFYAIGDTVQAISGKRKASGFAVDLQAELIGVFWLTYFNKRYVEFFGESKFKQVPYLDIPGGFLIKLGESPSSIDVTREDVEALLGKESFVDPGLQFDKPVGKSALRFGEF
ncbi:hypothetical protein L2596_003034 [Vibrio vulnificus]|uniref:hypothetical protein n=1 Tax=Vibrio vulnificus TaxID=672 RepID=UPI0034BE882F|nr:hypothetical protein [Vibrio vulnificus]EIT6976845.1 hypothetical protein [Vibrio vulnificus]